MEWVTCQNVQNETWRRLLEFANTELTYELIESIHGAATTSSKKQNYKKQASQVRSAILQAKEYFQAASLSSLNTSPNHLYYGMTSLNTATMLTLGNGDKSLDRLRLDKRNQSHGLIFTNGCSETASKTGLEILKTTHIEVAENGFFRNWYETLPKKGNIYGLTETIGSNGSYKSFNSIGHYKTDTFSEISGGKSSILGIIENIPDISTELYRFGKDIAFSRASISFIKDETRKTQKYQWLIHAAGNKDSLDAIREAFEFKGSDINTASETISENEKSGSISIAYYDGMEFNFPISRMDMNNQSYIYAAHSGLHEIVEAFGAGFAFSMLARYYPDIWVSCLESHGKAAKLIEHIIGVLILKYPILALSMISGKDTTISTHRPYWHQA